MDKSTPTRCEDEAAVVRSCRHGCRVEGDERLRNAADPPKRWWGEKRRLQESRRQENNENKSKGRPACHRRKKEECVMSVQSDSMLRLAFNMPAGEKLPCSIHTVKQQTRNFSAASLQQYICRHIDIS